MHTNRFERGKNVYLLSKTINLGLHSYADDEHI